MIYTIDSLDPDCPLVVTDPESVPAPHRVCQYCGGLGPIYRHRRNTRYAADVLNYLAGCRDCCEQDDKDMAQQWADYYGGCLG